MLTYDFRERATPDWSRLDRCRDRTIGQTREWCDFITETQRGRLVILEVLRDREPVGWFTGLVVKKFGLKMLGSPFPGWTTSYMGFNLQAGVDRGEILPPLFAYAFRELKCAHVELMDRHISVEDVQRLGLKHRVFRGYEIDLTQDEEALFVGMDSSCRRCIRKAEKSGVTIEIAQDDQFAEEYYDQLREVFARQRLVPTYPVERVRALVRHVLPTGHLLLLRAKDNEGHCIATAIIPAYNDTMYFWGGASRTEYRHLRPNEAIQWFAMRYWKNRGIAKYDMGGAGEYKEKYGGKNIAVPWVRQSRNGLLAASRDLARWSFDLRQRFKGIGKKVEVADED
jgi:CelD/BcsL family acetyltransferase involved in cellulose biosynthesis